ncbi:MAG: hypothetical protein MZV63_02450 [Marinilabiliales bacterium]|nr:hypothetical protein [Marinilabiliales bacterium]
MKELGDRLIDVHSQHQTLLLGDSMFQMRVIDAYAGNSKPLQGYTPVFTKAILLQEESMKLPAADNAERNKADHEYYSASA